MLDATGNRGRCFLLACRDPEELLDPATGAFAWLALPVGVLVK